MSELFDTKPLHFFTVGHSSHAAENFLELLKRHAVQVVVDTRSVPRSRFAPQFDRDRLKEMLAGAEMRYLWIGDVVGGRPRNESCYDPDGRVLYGKVAEQPEFREVVERLKRGAAEFRIALMCSEEDPSHCHRRLLLSRVLIGEGVVIDHIRGDGSLNTDEMVAKKSGKALVDKQPALFGEIEEEKWRSTGVIGKRAARSVME